MKIAFVSHPSTELRPPARGISVNIWTYQTARRLPTPSDVFVYSSNARGKSKEVLTEDGVTYIQVNRRLNDALNKIDRVTKRALRRIQAVKKDRTPFAASTQDLGYIAAVAWDLRKRDCDVVHVHNYSQFVPVLRLFNPDVRIVLHMHCEWLTQVDSSVIEPRLRQTDLIVGCSSYITNTIRDAFPQFAEKCATVYNGVDPDRFGTPDDGHAGSDDADRPFRILFMSRVSPEKGVHVLLEAMNRLTTTVPDVHLDVVGGQFSAPYEYIVGISSDPHVRALSEFYPQDGDWRTAYVSSLEEQIRDGLSDHVTMVGAIPHDQVLDYYQRADVVVGPSLSEAFGMSLIEAMASGVPVVVSRVGGMPEVVGEGEAGFIVPPADAEALARAIEQLYQNPNRRGEMGNAGRERVRRFFTWDRVASQLLDAYNTLHDTEEVSLYEPVNA